MEHNRFLVSALGVGIGVGVGIGLASGKTVSQWTGSALSSSRITTEMIEKELLRQVTDGSEDIVTFDRFPYYLSEQTRALLTSAAYVHLKQSEFSKHTRNLSPASQTILLSGPTELYQQMLAKALAHYFNAKLLMLDATDFSLKIQSKYGISSKETPFRRSISEAALEGLSGFWDSFSALPPMGGEKDTLQRQRSEDVISSEAESYFNPSSLRRNASASANISSINSQIKPANQASVKPSSSWSFDEKQFVQALYKVLVSVSKSSPIVLYLRDVKKLIYRSQRIYSLIRKMLNKLSGSILILGSQILDPESECREVDEKLTALFPYYIETRPPKDETHLISWKSQMEVDMKMIHFQDNKNHIMEVLESNDLDCDDLDSVCMADTVILSNYIEEIVVSAISYHLMNNKSPEYRNGKLIISSRSLSHGLSIFQESKSPVHPTSEPKVHGEHSRVCYGAVKRIITAQIPEIEPEGSAPVKITEAKKERESSLQTPTALEIPSDNEFEKRIRPDVLSADKIGVTFSDIGALEEIKESLQELVMLPLRRPDLFEGGLLKPCRGILLFGPPGTGKTMLAKAIAHDAGASFINVSMSTITSKWFGEDEKNVRALFTLAAKVAPTIIFVDEVDSMLGQRTRAGEHEAMRKIKNEFMSHWDGLLSRPCDRILVLAATNRPFDLDEAIIRRFERRIMVGLPTSENRGMIMKTLLSKERVTGVDFGELGNMTEGFSGSDLKNLCTTAAYRPVRELIQRERLKDLDRKQRGDEYEAWGSNSKSEKGEETRSITLRPLNMEDLRHAKKQIAASFAVGGSIMSELKQWNDLYGEGGSRKQQHQQLSYFL